MNRISWINVALGVWLAIVGALSLFHETGNGRVEDVIAGLFLALAALWAALAYRVGVSVVASWTVSLTGLWAAVAPFVLGYEHEDAAVANDVLVGLIIFVLAIVNVIAKERRLEQNAGGHNHRNRTVTA